MSLFMPRGNRERRACHRQKYQQPCWRPMNPTTIGCFVESHSGCPRGGVQSFVKLAEFLGANRHDRDAGCRDRWRNSERLFWQILPRHAKPIPRARIATTCHFVGVSILPSHIVHRPSLAQLAPEASRQSATRALTGGCFESSAPPTQPPSPRRRR